MRPLDQLLRVSCVLLAVFSAIPQTREKRITPVEANQAHQFIYADTVGVAVLVGVGRYPRFSGLSELRFPDSDVDTLAAALKKQRYLVVTLKDLDATKESVLNAINQAGEVLARENLTVIFFFSGHGFAVKSENYLATLDASANRLGETGLSVKAVEKALIDTRATRRVMWIDACRDEAGKGVDSRSFANLQAAAGTRMLLSTKAGKVSYEDDEFKQGVFTYYLVKGLQGDAAGPDKLVTFQDISSYVTLHVRERSLEAGHVQVPYETGEASGDFLIGQVSTSSLSGSGPAADQPPALPVPPPIQDPPTPLTHESLPPPSVAAQSMDVAARNKLLNDRFNTAAELLKTAQSSSGADQRVASYRASIGAFQQASELDPNQVAVWNGLGEAYTGLARSLSGVDQTDAYNQAIASFRRSLIVKAEGSVYNQLGNLYGIQGRLAEASDALSMAARLDPSIAGRAYFNMGANLVNNGHIENSAEYFKRSTEADPNYSESWFYYGAMLLRRGTVDPQTGAQIFPDDCKTSLLRYVQMRQSGGNVASAQLMLDAMQQKVPLIVSPLGQPNKADGKTIRISGSEAEASIVQKVAPIYPPAAKSARIQGIVSLDLLISKDGSPHNIRVTSSPSGLLSIAALDGVRQWRYKPIKADGIPVDALTTAIVNFTLSK